MQSATGGSALSLMRLVIARCSVGQSAHRPPADSPQLLLVKADGSVSIHADGGAYKPLNWMTPPCSVVIREMGRGQPRRARRSPPSGDPVDTSTSWASTRAW